MVDYSGGMLLAIKGFSAAMLGGMGSVAGAVLGSMVFALLESFAATYLSSTVKELITFVVIILVLMFLPNGLLGGRTPRRPDARGHPGMSGDELSATIAAHVSGARFEDLPPAAIDAARRSTLDTLAAMLAGSNAQGLDAIVSMAEAWGGAPQARVIGSSTRLPAPLAGWCNGTMARALEIDDCVDFLPVHPSASTVPALLALADARGGLSGRTSSPHWRSGRTSRSAWDWRCARTRCRAAATTCSRSSVPTAAVARALALDERRTLHALGISFSHAVGDGQCALEGALSLRLQQGIVAQGALTSGLLAERGFTGAREFLLGRWGYLRSFEPDPDLASLTDGLGQQFLGERISIKPYASCRATHEAIDLALELRAAIGGDARRVECIELTVSPEVERLVGLPRETRAKPTSSADAQFSLHFTVAAALARGTVFLAEMAEASYTEPGLLALASKVSVIGDPAMRTDRVVGRTRLVARLANGQDWSAQSDTPSGSPGRSPTPQQLRAKLAACAARARRPVHAAAQEELCVRVARLETLPDVRALLDALH